MFRLFYITVLNPVGSRRIRNNEEIDFLIKYADIVKYTKAQRIRWIEHIVRLDKERVVKITTEWRPIVVTRIGRLRLRWEVDGRQDLGLMKIQNWNKMAMDRELSIRPEQRVVAPREKGYVYSVLTIGISNFLDCPF